MRAARGVGDLLRRCERPVFHRGNTLRGSPTPEGEAGERDRCLLGACQARNWARSPSGKRTNVSARRTFLWQLLLWGFEGETAPRRRHDKLWQLNLNQSVQLLCGHVAYRCSGDMAAPSPQALDPEVTASKMLWLYTQDARRDMSFQIITAVEHNGERCRTYQRPQQQSGFQASGPLPIPIPNRVTTFLHAAPLLCCPCFVGEQLARYE